MKRPGSTALVLLLALGAWSCGAKSATAGDGTSGIQGVVLAGPQCPVQTAESPCPDKPYPGTVQATDAEGDTSQVKTDDQGRFRLPLKPGTYVVTIVLSSGGPPTAKPVSVAIVPGQFAQVTVEVDTGIR